MEIQVDEMNNLHIQLRLDEKNNIQGNFYSF